MSFEVGNTTYRHDSFPTEKVFQGRNGGGAYAFWVDDFSYKIKVC